MTVQLAIENVSKRFGGVKALDAVNLEISAGELVGLIGPNGSGKTTLLNIVSGYYDADHGQVRFEGHRVDGSDPDRLARAGIGRSFQVTKVFRRLSVLENLLVPALVDWRLAREEALRRVEGVLADLRLERVAHDRAGSLSGGQAKLLEFGRLMMLSPRLVLLDEPFGGVHPELKRFMYDVVRGWNERGLTIILISHDMGSIFGLCRRVVTLSYGRVIADGEPEAVRRDPAVIDAYLGKPHHA